MPIEKKQKNSNKHALLSVAIIAFNEERIIEKTLTSIQNWVDEIVVVDSYSTDGTVNILDMFSVKLYQRKWEGYANQKNFAIDKCTGEWILVLDADEIVSDALRDEILKTIKQAGIKKGFFIPRKLYIGNRWIQYGGYYPDYQLRLFKNNIGGHFPDRAVHESVNLKGPKGCLKNSLEHFAYSDVDEYSKALEKYAVLASKEITKKSFYVPFLRALWAFGYRYIGRKGFLEGEIGFELAKAYGKYVYKKYELAKKV